MIKEGQVAHLEHKGMMVRVKVLETKKTYGRTRHKVTPVAGKGTAVVEKLKKIGRPNK